MPNAPNAPNAPNETSQAQDRMCTRWWTNTVLRRCKRAGPISGRVMIQFQLPWPPIPMRWTRSGEIHVLCSGHLEQKPKPCTQVHGDDRPFGMGQLLICATRPMPTALRPLFTADDQGLLGSRLTSRGTDYADAGIDTNSSRISQSLCESCES